MQDYRILSRRERQIMNIIYQRGHASVAHVLSALPDPPRPSYLFHSPSPVANFGGKGTSYPRKRWTTLHLSSHATAPSRRTPCAQTDCLDLLR